MWAQEVIREIQQQASGGERVVQAAGEAGSVTAAVRQVDSLAIALDSLTARIPAVVPTLDEVGRRLAGSLTYLLEPLALLEVGADRALLRSLPPRKHDSAIDYYELWLRTDGDARSIEFQRYRSNRVERRRETIPMIFTWELVEHLLEDIHASLVP